MAEIATRGDIGRQGGVDGVVVEREKGERFEPAEDERERATDVCGGEVDGGNRTGGGFTRDAGPAARGIGPVVPAGKEAVRVIEGELGGL